MDGAAAFFSPPLKELLPPDLLPGATQAAGILAEAVRSDKKIVLYGDYDVDGTTGVSILWHILHQAGVDARVYVPHRITEGYGLNPEATKRLVADGAEVIVTVDCGITALEVARTLMDTGVVLIITDHHTPREELPAAAAIVHPALDNSYANPHLCGAGVAFKLAWAIAQQLSGSDRVSPGFRDLLGEMLPLAALGTIADVVPLTGENRIIARHGLERLCRTPLPGLCALLDSAGLTGRAIDDYDVGFKLAPRINAAGRMGHAELAVELFTRADTARAREIALYLDEHNRSRKAIEHKITKQAIAMIEERRLAADSRRAIVVSSKDWHPGVIGIVAARLVGKYHRPAVVIALNGADGQGSARSVEHFDLASALASCEDVLLSHGGHAMAAGLRVAAECVESFAARFVEVANNRLSGHDLTPTLRLDAEVTLDALTLPTAEAIQSMGPFGVGNPKPRFATGWVDLAGEPRCVGKVQDHLLATFRSNGVQMRAIGFGLAHVIEDLKQHRRCRVAFEPIINDFNNRRTVEMKMLDLKFPE